MKNLRITPLNLAMAGLLTWLLWQIWLGDFAWSKGFYALLLLVILMSADQYFRIFFKNIQKVWLIEMVFLVLVFVVTWVLKGWLG